MKTIKYFHKACLVLIIGMVLQLASSDLVAQSSDQVANQDRQSEIEVHSWVDRTALFPGDTVTFHVEILCNSNVDILLDDLDADELGLSGLDLVDSQLVQESTSSGTKYHASYALISFETDRPDLSIDELRVRYYFKRPGQRIEDVASVGEVVVPATSLVLRSTLPTELSELELRDMAPALILSSWLGFAGTLGLLLIIVSVFPVGLMISSRIRQEDTDLRHQLDEELQETSSELEQIKKFDAEDTQQRRQGFEQLQNVLKEYIEKRFGISAIALTASELQVQLSDTDIRLSVNELTSVLEDCERARYGRPGNLPDVQRFEHGILLAQSLFTRE